MEARQHGLGTRIARTERKIWLIRLPGPDVRPPQCSAYLRTRRVEANRVIHRHTDTLRRSLMVSILAGVRQKMKATSLATRVTRACIEGIILGNKRDGRID